MRVTILLAILCVAFACNAYQNFVISKQSELINSQREQLIHNINHD